MEPLVSCHAMLQNGEPIALLIHYCHNANILIVCHGPALVFVVQLHVRVRESGYASCHAAINCATIHASMLAGWNAFASVRLNPLQR